MILVTLGTQDKAFPRLLEAIETQLEKGTINDEVIVQAGCTVFESKQMNLFDLIPMEQFDQLLAQCDLLITHGGVGTIMAGLRLGKKIIAAPRLAQYHEHHNDHQTEIVSSFERQGYLLALHDFDRMGEVLKQAETFQPKPVVSNTANMIELIDNWIQTNA